jgi:Protein of unknown function (DUF3224)
MRRVIAVMLVLCAAGTAAAQRDAAAPAHARGAFDVKLVPQSTDPVLGRMTADKQYHGDLDGTGKGEMLTGMTAVKDSAVYVAVERVTGTLNGRRGSFILSHIGTMNRGAQDLKISIVPDSGTDQLTGITGRMSITIDKDGKHFYELEYSLPM